MSSYLIGYINLRGAPRNLLAFFEKNQNRFILQDYELLPNRGSSLENKLVSIFAAWVCLHLVQPYKLAVFSEVSHFGLTPDISAGSQIDTASTNNLFALDLLRRKGHLRNEV